jgi:colanic acid biosynthesis protein WcaH
VVYSGGGRILKNEPWADCLKRIAQCELGLTVDDTEHFKLMVVWDHFYENSLLAEDVSTHYANLPHPICLEHFPDLQLDEQHNEIKWFSLREIADNNIFHKYVRNYASYLLKHGY